MLALNRSLRPLLAGFVAVSLSQFALPARAATTQKLGALVVTISTSETAQVFHIVDQLSQWSPYCHKQYVRWAEQRHLLGNTERALLKRHAEVRKRLGWSGGLEQAFYTDLSIDEAAERAVRDGVIDEADAAAEREILHHFQPLLVPLTAREADAAKSFEQRLKTQAPRVAHVTEQLAHFTHSRAPLEVPAYFIANPSKHSVGGGYNGGMLVVEVGNGGLDPLPTFLHESLHAFLKTQKAYLDAHVFPASGLDRETVEEGIAYALAPGILGLTGDQEFDDLAGILAQQLARGATYDNPYIKRELVALVFRPVLKDALDRGQTIEQFLPKAIAVWQSYGPGWSPRPSPRPSTQGGT